MYPQTLQDTKIEGYLADNYAIYHCVLHHYSISHGNKRHVSAIIISNSESISKLKSILTSLYSNNTTANLLITSILNSNLLANNTHYLLAAATSNIPASTNLNTATKLTSNQNTKTENDITKLKIGNSCSSTNFQTCSRNLETRYVQYSNSQHYLSLLVTPKDASSNNQKPNQNKSLISNIPPVTVTNNKLLAAIFLFEFKELSQTPLFSKTALEEKPITAMYTDAKVNGHQINCAASTKIITANGATKTPIGKIDDFSIENCNSVRIDDTHKYQQYVDISNPITTCQYYLLKEKEKKKEKEEESTPAIISTYTPYTYSSLYQTQLEPKFRYCPKIHGSRTILQILPRTSTYKRRAEAMLGRNKHLTIRCILESELLFNPNSNSDNNNNKNNSSSSIQNGNKNYDDSNSDSNFEQYIALSDLSKKQKLK
ncbi:hypothetical protein G9A89_018842 [Geosiphon pyriformis]|nr:hypothetical protein G9A89_018842 [Geosiphon pyriformis]